MGEICNSSGKIAIQRAVIWVPLQVVAFDELLYLLLDLLRVRLEHPKRIDNFLD
jgi:hypothetical protein